MSSAATDMPTSIGWIGLGLMGLPMARNLIKKTTKETTLYVYDVVEHAVKQLVEEGNGRVQACQSSKEVADKSVCHATPFFSLKGTVTLTDFKQ